MWLVEWPASGWGGVWGGNGPCRWSLGDIWLYLCCKYFLWGHMTCVHILYHSYSGTEVVQIAISSPNYKVSKLFTCTPFSTEFIVLTNMIKIKPTYHWKAMMLGYPLHNFPRFYCAWFLRYSHTKLKWQNMQTVLTHTVYPLKRNRLSIG